MLRHKPTLKSFTTAEQARRHYAQYSAKLNSNGESISLDPSSVDLLAQLNAVGYYTDETQSPESTQTLNGEFVWNDELFTVSQGIVERETYIPFSISIRQARIVLSRNDLLSSVEQIVNSIGGEASIEWEYATSVDRSNPLVAKVTEQAGMTKEQVDQMFIEGSTL